MRFTFRFCAFLVAFFAFSSLLWSQYNFKRVFAPDALSIGNVSFLTARGVVGTNIQDREIALVGAVAGQDSSGAFIQSAYLLQTDDKGVPQYFNFYTDTSSFLLSGPRGFDLCYDGSTGFYLALGSNDNQLVVRTDNYGAMQWITDVNHHDFYSVICEGTQVTLLGQDESLLGGHDYSAIQVDSSGNTFAGNLFGSTDFDIPIAMGGLSDGYVLTGQSYASPRGMMIVKASPQLNLLWGEVFQLPGRQMFMLDATVSPAGDAIFCTGHVTPDATGNADSVFVAKLDTAGNPLWFRLYGSDTLTDITANAIIAAPARNTILVGGDFDATGYGNSYVMRLDSAGDFIWAQDYSDRDTSLEESIQALAFAQDNKSFYATGRHVHIDTNFFTTHSVFLLKAPVEDGGLPCDTPLVLGHRNATIVPGNIVFPYPAANLPTNPYPFTPASGEMNDSLRCDVMNSVSVSEAEDRRLSVVNPAYGSLKATCIVDLGGAELELRDMNGRLLYRRELEQGYQQLRIPAWKWPAGLYLLSLRNHAGALETRKIILEKP